MLKNATTFVLSRFTLQPIFLMLALKEKN
ncbi:unnamed protein product [Acanthoscelides obtectus]|uniref:Uncharacterized protein n=1 Tax=Acanthoscelides obtectus TaxID=200917 RepID=A0A9P0KY59_ACAOB|nr:unnamed protein product [Acanthoscelides obtectus]CAK1653510.1 hypothetical protein AOBTE_LOCUS18266 [Acanthoscelides obtectus]